ncbi:MAG: polysaccharide biosynthesis C-terminal domain-containing protein [Pseudomonadota bacterium]
MADNYYSGLFIGLAARLLALGTSFVVIWAFNLAGREVYGVYAYAGSLAAIAVVIGSFGLDQLLLYRSSQRSAEPQLPLLAAASGRATRISLAVAAAFLAYGFINTRYVAHSANLPVYAALAATIPALAAANVFAAWHQGRQDFRKALLIPRASDAIRLLCFLPLGLFIPDVDLYLLVIVISAWVPMLLYRIDSGALRGQAGGIDAAGRRYAGHMALIGLVRSGIDNIDIIMVGLLTTLDATAAYALASRAAAFALLGNQLLGQVTLPRIGAALGASDLAGMMYEYDRHRWLSLLAVLAVALLLVLFGPALLGLFGSYADALPVMYVLLATHVFACSFGPVGNALKMGGHATQLLASVWVLLALLFVTNLVLIPWLGIVGAALGTLLSLVAINLLNWWQCYRIYGLRTTGPLALGVMTAGNAGIYLVATDRSAEGLALLCAALVVTLGRALQGGIKLTKSMGI